MDHNAGGRHDPVVGVDIVGDVQQARQKGLVGADRLGLDGVTIAAARQVLGEEATLGADRHDHRVLDLLGLDQAQNLGAEVVAAIGPPQAAPGDRAKAQVHALDMRGRDIDLAIGLGGRQVLQLTRSDLVADIGLGLAVRSGLEEVGPLDGADQGGDAAQDAVGVQALDRLQGLADARFHGLGLVLAGLQIGAHGRVELDAEQVEDQTGDAGIVRQGPLLNALAGIQAGLLAIASQGPNEGGLAPADAQLQDQAVEAVALGPVRPDRDEGGLEGGLDVAERQVLATLVAQCELVDPDLGVRAARVMGGRGQLEAVLDQGLQAHVLEDRQHVGQGRGGAGAIELEAEGQLVVVGMAEGPHPHGLVGGEVVNDGEVGQGLGGVVLVAIAGREGALPAGQGLGDAARRAAVADGGLEAVFPGAGGLGDGGFQRFQVRIAVLARRHAQHVVHPGERGVGEAGIVGADPPLIGVGQDLAGPLAHAAVIALARHEHQHRDEAVERVLASEQSHARPVVEVQHPQGHRQQLVLGDLEQLVARPSLQDVAQALAAVAFGILAGFAEHVLDLAADHRHLVGGRLVGLGGEQAHEADLARGLAVGAVPAHPDIVHIAATVDLGAQVRLGHHQGRAQQQVVADLGRQDRRLAASAQHRQGLVAQHAQAALGLVQRLLGGVTAVWRAGIFVDPGPEEHEVVAFQPVEEGQALGALGLGNGHGRGAQFVDRAMDQRLHGAEVVDRHLDIGQGVANSGDQGLFAVLAHRGQIDLDHRAAAGPIAHAKTVDHRVEHGPHREALLGDGAHDAVDQKRAVGLDDLQQVAFQVGSVGAARGAHTDREGGGHGLAEPPEIDPALGQVGGLEPGEFLGRPVLLDLGGEGGLRRGQRLHAQSSSEGRDQISRMSCGCRGVKFCTDHGISSRIFGDNLALSGPVSTSYRE